MLSDLLNYDLADVGLAVLGSGRLGFNRSELDQKQQAFYGMVFSRQLRDAERRFSRHWDGKSASQGQDEFFVEADRAVEEEFGIGLFDVREGYHLLASTASESGQAFMKRPVAWVLDHLSKELGWTADKAARFVDLLTLGPRDNYLRPRPPHKNHDVVPWRFNRRLSYLRRPLILRETAGDRELLWTPRNTYRSGSYFYGLILDARLPPHGEKQSAAMSSFMGKTNGASGKGLEKKVAAGFADDPHFVARSPVNKVGGESVGPVGDMDAIVCDVPHRIAYVCECKNLFMAKTPYEMRQQFDSVYNADPGKKTAVSQAQKKARWLDDRKAALLADFGIGPNDAEQWQIQPLVVVEHRMFAAMLRSAPIQIVAFEDLHPLMKGKL